ncbi:MAG: L-threonylcarbamoyladenylate synthase [Fulvivirga sp.]|nr:L-threonylcarbamoyladenylate synthase [Fulvivirga sp.]
MAVIGTDIQKAKNVLLQEGLIGMPTETVYGLGGNALNTNAVASIFNAKNRPHFDPLILHTYHFNEIEKYVADIPEEAVKLAKAYWPGPLTLLLKKKQLIPDLVTSGMDTVAIRIPNKPITLKLLESLPFPLVAPSANPFGYISPTTAQHVNDQLGDKVDYILDGGPCEVGIESTIIGFDKDGAVIHRMGGLSQEEIEQLVGQVKLKPHSTSNPKAPGMLKSHYAPKKELILGKLQALQSRFKTKRLGVIAFDKYLEGVDQANQVVLAPTGDLKEAAKNLFSGLRILDNQKIDLIIAEPVPDHGLGRAINDRLRRAAAK